LGQDNSTPEVMLAQEQAVIRRGPGIRKGVEAAFGLGGETEGTLVLTDRRLVYVHSNEKEESIRIGAFSAKHLYFSDIESVSSMPLDSASVEIPISRIAKVAGHHGEAIAPKLEVSWSDAKGTVQATEFVQQISGASRRRNLNDWAKVIEKLKAKQLKIKPLPPAPGEDSLGGKVLVVLGDMQEKGLMTIESEAEEQYKVDLDPDDVEAALEKLVTAGLVVKPSARYEDVYYRKASPLGEDDLSS
jgi:hypothetical protein